MQKVCKVLETKKSADVRIGKGYHIWVPFESSSLVKYNPSFWTPNQKYRNIHQLPHFDYLLIRWVHNPNMYVDVDVTCKL